MRALAAILLLTSLAFAQEPSSHFRRYAVAQALLEGADALFTDQNVCRYDWIRCSHSTGGELNPLARPFLKHESTLALYFSGEAAFKIGASYLAHRKARRLERYVEMGGLGSSASGVGYSGYEFFRNRNH